MKCHNCGAEIPEKECFICGYVNKETSKPKKKKGFFGRLFEEPEPRPIQQVQYRSKTVKTITIGGVKYNSWDEVPDHCLKDIPISLLDEEVRARAEKVQARINASNIKKEERKQQVEKVPDSSDFLYPSDWLLVSYFNHEFEECRNLASIYEIDNDFEDDENIIKFLMALTEDIESLKQIVFLEQKYLDMVQSFHDTEELELGLISIENDFYNLKSQGILNSTLQTLIRGLENEFRAILVWNIVGNHEEAIEHLKLANEAYSNIHDYFRGDRAFLEYCVIKQLGNIDTECDLTIDEVDRTGWLNWIEIKSLIRGAFPFPDTYCHSSQSTIIIHEYMARKLVDYGYKGQHFIRTPLGYKETIWLERPEAVTQQLKTELLDWLEKNIGKTDLYFEEVEE